MLDPDLITGFRELLYNLGYRCHALFSAGLFPGNSNNDRHGCRAF